MDIYIKNTDTIAHVWSGQQIQPGEYYLLEGLEKPRWQNNSQLLSDIGSGIAIVARNGSGSEDIIDVATAIDFLKGELPKNVDGLLIVAPTFEEHQGLTVVWKGSLYTATAGALNIFDEVVTTQIKVRGGWYELMDANAVVGDYIEFSIIDKDDVLGLFATYGLTVGVDILELKKFIRKEYVNPSIHVRQDFNSEGASTVVAGLYMRVTYLSTGSNDVQFKKMEKYHEI